MPEESTTPDLVELVGRAFEVANRRDLDAVASSFAEDATFDGRGVPEHYEGRAAIRSMIEDWFGSYDELEFGLEEVRDLGNGVVFAVVVQNARPAGSAGHLRQREGWVFVWVRGLIARLATYEVDVARAAAERLAESRLQAMSQENLEIVRRWLWAFDNDTDAFRQVTHPEIEWMPFEDNHTPSHGLDGAMQIRNGWIDAWVEHRVDIEEMLDGGDDVFASALLAGRGKASGVAVEVRLYGHFKVRDGGVVYLFEHQDRSEALKAVGLEQ